MPVPRDASRSRGMRMRCCASGWGMPSLATTGGRRHGAGTRCSPHSMPRRPAAVDASPSGTASPRGARSPTRKRTGSRTSSWRGSIATSPHIPRRRPCRLCAPGRLSRMRVLGGLNRLGALGRVNRLSRLGTLGGLSRLGVLCRLCALDRRHGLRVLGGLNSLGALGSLGVLCRLVRRDLTPRIPRDRLCSRRCSDPMGPDGCRTTAAGRADGRGR
ncbi:hypothetical protein G1C96_1507 [Bifidobacterium sp. DSM 109958]|uniref:Uncharacterized protein n=1 Tax=Bifidobacterium moraviense TaxID=2675323 RepID=A0A7Y0F2W4_9BIFI|nr:hypothetical protein [Bifidobacterium sp. DSM 109958]